MKRKNKYVNGARISTPELGYDDLVGFGYKKHFRGMNKNTFEQHLKECEFRFNNRAGNLYGILLKEFRKLS